MIVSIISYIIVLSLLLAFSKSYVKYWPDSEVRLIASPVVLLFIVYIVFCAVRFDVGVDYMTYYLEFKECHIFTNYTDLKNKELGWAYFTWLLSKNNVHYTIYFGLIGGVQFYFLLESFKNDKRLLPFLIFTYFIGGYFIDCQNVLRQNIVMLVFLYMVMRHRNAKFIYYCIVACLCFFVHKSSFIIILLYPIFHYKLYFLFRRNVAIFIFLFCVLIGYSRDLFSSIANNAIFIGLLSGSDYGTYANDTYLTMGTSKSMGLGFLLKILTDFVLIFYSKKIIEFFKSSDNNISFYYQLFFIGISLRYLFPTSMVLGRPLLYLTIFSIPMTTYFLYYIFHSKYRKWSFNKLILYGYLTSIILLFVVNHIIKPEGNKAEIHYYWENLY